MAFRAPDLHNIAVRGPAVHVAAEVGIDDVRHQHVRGPGVGAVAIVTTVLVDGTDALGTV